MIDKDIQLCAWADAWLIMCAYAAICMYDARQGDHDACGYRQ